MPAPVIAYLTSTYTQCAPSSMPTPAAKHISALPHLLNLESGWNMDGEIPNIKRWVVLYPVYINSKKTIAEGRRIGVSKACENPTCAEIGDCCSHLKLPFAIEIDKAYPRDFMQRGRVRVLLKKEDGTLSNPAIPSRKQLMLRIAELVPRHPGRIKKQEPASSSTAGPSKGKGGRKKK
ncbi:Signal recognition particle 19 kDa protein, partial [Cucurbita argyrosperma subsp. sororia]